MKPLKIEVVRKNVVEATHIVHAIALDENGKQVVAFGNAEILTYWRSSAKPFQAMAVVATGAADAFGLNLKELAIACGSHPGSSEHIAVVKSILAKAELTESQLQCGIHEPYDAEERIRLIRNGLKPSPLHSNCSGKHAAMLLAAKHIGAPLETYRLPDHSVQKLIAQILVAATGDEKLTETVVPDGCGASIWASSLWSIALAFHRLVTQTLPDLDTCLPIELPINEAAKRLIEAMAQNPDMVSDKDNWNTRLIELTNGRFIGKGGAEGLFAGAFRDGQAIAVKVQDGNHRATPIAVKSLLAYLGWLNKSELEALSEFHKPVIKNLRGEEVGFMRILM